MDTLTLNGKKFILVPEADYRKMTSSRLPPLPSADAQGNRPALAFATANIARDIITRREAAGLTQKQLAQKAGIAPAVLNRAERGTVIPSVPTLQKIESALRSASRGRA